MTAFKVSKSKLLDYLDSQKVQEILQSPLHLTRGNLAPPLLQLQPWLVHNANPGLWLVHEQDSSQKAFMIVFNK